jgi:hypothetical protein
MVEAPKQTSSPDTGCRQDLVDRARSAGDNSPAAGGAASKGPMIAKRRRAQRSRLRGSTGEVKRSFQNVGAGGTRTGREGYKPWPQSPIHILCGKSATPAQRGRPNRDRRQKEEQMPHGCCGVADKTFQQTGRKAFRDRRQEARTKGLPEGAPWELVFPPLAPTFQGTQRNRQRRGKPRRPWVLPGMPGRTQHHQQRQIDAPAQEPYRHRRRPTATTIAAEAEPPSKVGAHFRRTPSRLSWIVGTVQNAAARTSQPLAPRPPAPRQRAATIEKTGDSAVGHGTLASSLGTETRDSPKGRVCSSSLRGVTPANITLLDHSRRKFHQER